MDNLMLNRYYESQVKMTQDETRKNVDFVMPVVQDILSYVHQRDPRFKTQPLNVGSYYSHLKVKRADEFDYSVVLDVGRLHWISSTKPAYFGYNEQKRDVEKRSYALPPGPVGKPLTYLGEMENWNKQRLNEGPGCLTIDGFIIPIKVKRRFKSLLGEAVNRPSAKMQYIDAKRLSESPAATLTLRHPGIAGKEISIDLAPLIEGHLPFKNEFGWPRSSARWPTQLKIDEIKREGIHEVAKDPIYWSLSFVTCEKILLDRIDINGTCRAKSQRIMKKLRELFCPNGMKQELTSYHLKNILFWECENHPYDHEWEQDQLANRIESMCQLLIRFIQRGNLPLYFHTGVNLFETKDRKVMNIICQNIFNFLNNPSRYLE